MAPIAGCEASSVDGKQNKERRNMEPGTDQFVTKDIFLSAFLLASGQVTLTDVKPEGNSRICYFLFSPKDKATSLCSGYWNKSATVIAREYSDCLRVLKDRLFGTR